MLNGIEGNQPRGPMSETLRRIRGGDLPLDFDWNRQIDYTGQSRLPEAIPAEAKPSQVSKVQLVSEDLRDGLHGVDVYPTVPQMLRVVRTLNDLGIRDMTVGIFPGKDTEVDRSIREVLMVMNRDYSNVTPIVLSTTRPDSLEWVVDCKRINPNLETIAFMGTAPSRLLVEGWQKEDILAKLGDAINYLTKRNVPVIGATEHTTQTPPAFLREIITTQIKSGAKRICIADTIGTARPSGTYRIVRFVKEVLADLHTSVPVDWHGHDDLGNGVANAMVAIAAGADRIHTVTRGLGERAGNTRLEGVLVNIDQILKNTQIKNPWNMRLLSELITTYTEITKSRGLQTGPLGDRAFHTSLGIHCAAMLKALALSKEAREFGEDDIADALTNMYNTIYTAVNPLSVGRQHEIGIGPWSGDATVRLAYSLMGGNGDELTQQDIQNILKKAKDIKRELTKEELEQMLNPSLLNINAS